MLRNFKQVVLNLKIIISLVLIRDFGNIYIYVCFTRDIVIKIRVSKNINVLGVD